jgi:hypothetical protein
MVVVERAWLGQRALASSIHSYACLLSHGYALFQRKENQDGALTIMITTERSG